MAKEFDSQYIYTAQGLGFRPDLSQVVRFRQQARSVGLFPERAPLFSGMSQAEYAKLSAAARLKEFARGEMLYIEGDSVQQVILLTAGVVKITQLGMRGTEVILRLGIPGDVLGVLGLFSTGRHGTTAQAFRACHTLVWEAATFRCLVERMPAIHHNLVRILGEYLDELEARFREVATEKVAARVARQLIRLRNRIGRSVAGAVEVGISREELAQMTGTTLFTVSRLLSAWEARGILRLGREAVAIIDTQSLAFLAEES